MSLLPLGFLQNIGWFELVVILVIVLLIFGHRLPGLGRSLGRSLTEFKSGLKDGQKEGEKDEKKDEKPAQTAEGKEAEKAKEQKVG